MDNLILIDWLSFTSRSDSIDSIIDYLGLQKCTMVNLSGMYGYKDRQHYEGINIHYNHNDDKMPNVWVEMSGTGCRSYETYGAADWKDLLEVVSNYNDGYNITRVDVAYDDHIGVLPMVRLVRDTIAQNYVSKWEYWEVAQSSKGSTLYHGSPQSKIRLRIYDKAAEKGKDEHWIRCELQLRDEQARAMALLGVDNIGSNFCGVLKNYLRYLVPSKTNSQKCRWSTAPYWNKFLGNAQAIKLHTAPGEEYNMARVKNYVYEQAGNSIATIIAVDGVDKMIKELKERNSSLSKKQIALIDKYRKLEV